MARRERVAEQFVGLRLVGPDAERSIGRVLQPSATVPAEQRFAVWVLGALLFGFFVTFWSILLFDQSVIFFWLTIAAIESAARNPRRVDAPLPARAGSRALIARSTLPLDEVPAR